jgi:NADH-quinone oxidoreductase subunit J
MRLLFTILAMLTVAGAVAAMSLRNLVHSVLALTVAFSGLAGVYLLLGAQFLGLAQVLVYVGAVAILIVFAVLLTRNSEATPRSIHSSSRRSASLAGSGLVVVAVFAVVAWAISHSIASRSNAALQPAATAKEIGSSLMQQFAFPLEIIGLLLTAALLGAVTIAVREKQETR